MCPARLHQASVPVRSAHVKWARNPDCRMRIAKRHGSPLKSAPCNPRTNNGIECVLVRGRSSVQYTPAALLNSTPPRSAGGRERLLLRRIRTADQRHIVRNRFWPADEIALVLVAGFAGEYLELFLGFHILRHHRRSEPAAERDHRARWWPLARCGRDWR